jgi:twitching motility two-component system response regulator PilH
MQNRLNSPESFVSETKQLILVVDDSATDRFYISDLLGKNGFEVITAVDGDDAVTKARSNKPSVVVMDVVMPGRSGFQVTRALRRDPETERIPVIIVSSKDNETDRIWGMRQGASDYMTKPVRADELLAKVKELLH